MTALRRGASALIAVRTLAASSPTTVSVLAPSQEAEGGEPKRTRSELVVRVEDLLTHRGFVLKIWSKLITKGKKRLAERCSIVALRFR